MEDLQTAINEILTNEPPKQHRRLINELKKKYDTKEDKGLFSKKKSN